ncbi:MAG: hypothetical protein GKC04_04955 [Methanomicrobiales archaeon]|nr:hypothetical protein [Methanomicrobiales archaeon]
MDYLTSIPADKRWAIATRAVTALPFAYHQAAREIAGPGKEAALSEMERRIWEEAGREQAVLARELGCPLENALQVAKTFSTLSTVILGPEMEGAVSAAEGDAARVTTTSCPMEKNARIFGADLRETCMSCNAYTTAAVRQLNSNYTVLHQNQMCTGAPSCEFRIERRSR